MLGEGSVVGVEVAVGEGVTMGVALGGGVRLRPAGSVGAAVRAAAALGQNLLGRRLAPGRSHYTPRAGASDLLR